MGDTVLVVQDDDGVEVELDEAEAASLLALLGGLDDATTSACPDCRSRVVAAVALVDLLGDAPPHPRTFDLVTLADDAPTLHLYVDDRATGCRHLRWVDPGFEEWIDAVSLPAPRPRW